MHRQGVRRVNSMRLATWSAAFVRGVCGSLFSPPCFVVFRHAPSSAHRTHVTRGPRPASPERVFSTKKRVKVFEGRHCALKRPVEQIDDTPAQRTMRRGSCPLREMRVMIVDERSSQCWRQRRVEVAERRQYTSSKPCRKIRTGITKKCRIPFKYMKEKSSGRMETMAKAEVVDRSFGGCSNKYFPRWTRRWKNELL